MKKIFIILAVVVLMAGCSQEAEAYGDYDICDSFFGKLYNDCHEVSHPTPDKRSTEIGVGVDLIIYEGEEGAVINKVTGEYRYDIRNSEHKGYGVATSKLADIWNAIKSLFGRE